MPEEAAERIQTIVKLCDFFKCVFGDVKQATQGTDHQWNYDARRVFTKLDLFLGRVRDIAELFETIIEFSRLEKIEIGGAKGKILSAQVAQIFAEFSAALGVFGRIKYDVLNLALPDFERDLSRFRYVIADLDKRLGYNRGTW